MDREKLFRHLEQRYTSKRDMISRVPLGVQPDALWQELLNQRRSKSTVLPLFSYKGTPFWYVTTDKMVAASEKIVEALFENETEYDPYKGAPVVSTLEEVFFTSYVEGSQITIQAAMDFLTGGQPPRDIEEQMIANNRQASNYASANLYRPIDAALLRELISILTDGMDDGGQDYRTTDAVDFSPPDGERYDFPSPRIVPDRVGELAAFLASPQTHPLIKAATAQAYMMILRPFPEGNERLGRMLSSMILLRAGYTFFSEVSLSALIARKSYGYYEAMANILREENGGDLTYFLEYFLELLSRAVDERRLRLNRKEEQARQAEQDLARTTLAPAAQALPPTLDDSPKDHATPVQTAKAAQAEEVVSDLSGFQTVPIVDTPESGIDRSVQGTPIELLTHYTQSTAKVIGQLSVFLLRKMDTGQMQFTTGEIAAALNVIPRQLSSSIRYLKEQGVIRLEHRDSHQKYYKICTEEESREILSRPAAQETEEPECDPEVLARIDELVQSNSPKDKRIGGLLLECMKKGEVTVDDYAAIGESTKWLADMQLASQMGLVEKISTQRYAILRTLKSGPLSLSKGQRRFITEMYESFGDDIFSTEMVIATLDYSGAHISAYLHQFTLLRILDCKKEDVYRYQFLINPEEHPECFDLVA